MYISFRTHSVTFSNHPFQSSKSRLSNRWQSCTFWQKTYGVSNDNIFTNNRIQMLAQYFYKGSVFGWCNSTRKWKNGCVPNFWLNNSTGIAQNAMYYVTNLTRKFLGNVQEFIDPLSIALLYCAVILASVRVFLLSQDFQTWTLSNCFTTRVSHPF